MLTTRAGLGALILATFLGSAMWAGVVRIILGAISDVR